ncbi:MAG: SGNH/GDSL hydrolase family protein [Prevotella sp.]|nr:SGNH/GDSL hydrolase family protein [Prevotella sp.]
MKRTVKTITLAAAMLFATGNMQAQRHDFANYQRYAEENAQLGKPQKKEKRVVFMGNSITEGWVRQHPDFFKEHGYIGRGISGQTSYQFLLRFRQDVIDLQPKLVVINYGTNDIAENTGKYDEDQTFGNVASMCELAKANGIKVILTSTLPAGNFPWRLEIKDSMEKIRSLNARVKAYAEKNKIPFVDYFSAMLSEDGTRMNTAYTPEQVHPNGKGYDVMEALIVPAIKKALK